MTLPLPSSDSNCSVCGTAFSCGVKTGQARCWCEALPAIPLTSVDMAAGCLCPACLQARLVNLNLQPPAD